MHENLNLKKIKKSFLGIFYLKYLKKYMLLRIIFNFIFWRMLYLMVIEIGFYFFFKYKDFNTLNSNFTHKIINKLKGQNKFKIDIKTTNLSKPNINNLFRSNSKIKKFKIFSLEKIKIIQNSDFFFSNDKIFHHEFYNFQKDYTSEELHAIVKINSSKTKIKSLEFDKNLYYSKGAIFTHSCSHNYSH